MSTSVLGMLLASGMLLVQAQGVLAEDQVDPPTMDDGMANVPQDDNLSADEGMSGDQMQGEMDSGDSMGDGEGQPNPEDEAPSSNFE